MTFVLCLKVVYWVCVGWFGWWLGDEPWHVKRGCEFSQP